MKFGVLQAGYIAEYASNQKVNIGDMIQADAVRYVYSQMDVASSDLVEIDINDISNYDGEYLILPININLSFNWCLNIFPLPPKIIPVFLGLSYFSAEELPKGLCDYFRLYAPIGCRDEATMELLRKNNIPAYLFGCITAVFPKRDASLRGRKTFFVDVPDSLRSFIPESILNDRENTIFSSQHYSGDSFWNMELVKKTSRDLLEKYRTEAKLVVTSKLHCMSPCVAMGIPVIAVVENCSPRMAWIDKFIPIYTPEQYEKINWEPDLGVDENAKTRMMQVAIARIRQAYKEHVDICDLSFFYEKRIKSDYGNFYKSVLQRLPANLPANFTYIIWGTGQIGIHSHKIITELYPSSKMVLAVDSYCEGNFFGIEIQKPTKITEYPSAFVFIATYSGEKCAEDKMKQLGKKQIRDYLSFATLSG